MRTSRFLGTRASSRRRRRRRRLGGNRRVLLHARGRFHVSGPRECRVYRVCTLEGGINRSCAQISRSLLLRDVPRKRSASASRTICIRLDFMPLRARTAYSPSRKFYFAVRSKPCNGKPLLVPMSNRLLSKLNHARVQFFFSDQFAGTCNLRSFATSSVNSLLQK